MLRQIPRADHNFSVVGASVIITLLHTVFFCISTKSIVKSTMSNEQTPLLPSNASGSESSKYYFLKDGSQQGGTSESVRDADGGPVHETLPPGATPEEFAPRIIGSPVAVGFL